MEIGQISPVYLHDVESIQKVLQQRNHYLNNMQMKKQTDETMLDILTEQFIAFAVKIVQSGLSFSNCCKNGQNQSIKEYLERLEELKIQLQTICRGIRRTRIVENDKYI